MSAEPVLPEGTLIGERFVIEGPLGQGGMGAVYRARQKIVNRPVALKILKPDAAAKPGAVDRFLAEAQAVSQLKNPHTVTLFDVGHTDGNQLYYAMERIEGEPLSIVIARGPLPWRRALTIASQIAESLGEAHGRGIYHRDIKPDNVLLEAGHVEDDFVKVVDFGIAKLQDESVVRTKTGIILGTPAYLSPEQARADEVDGRTDIYSLGVVLFEMLAGRLPFKDQKVTALLLRHVNEPAPSLCKVHPELETPSEVDALVQDMMAKDPEDRPSSAQALRDRIATLLEPSIPPPPPAWMQWLLAGLAVTVAIGASLWVFTDDPPPPPQPDGQVQDAASPDIQPVYAVPDARHDVAPPDVVAPTQNDPPPVTKPSPKRRRHGARKVPKTSHPDAAPEPDPPPTTDVETVDGVSGQF